MGYCPEFCFDLSEIGPLEGFEQSRDGVSLELKWISFAAILKVTSGVGPRVNAWTAGTSEGLWKLMKA